MSGASQLNIRNSRALSSQENSFQRSPQPNALNSSLGPSGGTKDKT